MIITPLLNLCVNFFLVQQNISVQSNPDPDNFTGEYFTDDLITLHKTPIYIKNHKESGTVQYLALQFLQFNFPLTYIGDYVFEIVYDHRCTDFPLGINGERLYFTKPKNPKSNVDEFVIYGINLPGMTTFHRKSTMKT